MQLSPVPLSFPDAHAYASILQPLVVEEVRGQLVQALAALPAQEWLSVRVEDWKPPKPRADRPGAAGCGLAHVRPCGLVTERLSLKPTDIVVLTDCKVATYIGL